MPIAKSTQHKCTMDTCQHYQHTSPMQSLCVSESNVQIYHCRRFADFPSKTTLNYRVIVERYPFVNKVVGGSIPAVKSSLYSTEKTLARWVGSQEPTHRKVGNKLHPAPEDSWVGHGQHAQIHVKLPDVGCYLLWMFYNKKYTVIEPFQKRRCARWLVFDISDHNQPHMSCVTTYILLISNKMLWRPVRLLV